MPACFPFFFQLGDKSQVNSPCSVMLSVTVSPEQEMSWTFQKKPLLPVPEFSRGVNALGMREEMLTGAE